MQSLRQIVQIDQAIDDLKGVFPGVDDFNYLRRQSGVNYIAFRRSQIAGLPYICTRAEFEARKAERQGKPSWDDAPKWAQWLAQDLSGAWFFYKTKPYVIPGIWFGGSVSHRQGIGEVIGDWHNTLEQRPNQIHPTGDLGRSSGTVGANHIGESDEKVSTYAELEQAAQACKRALNEFFPEVKLGNSADWYDYENQTVIKLPPVGAKFELYPFSHPCEVVAHHDGGAVIYDKKALEYVHIKYGNFRCRPLDFNRKPEPSPELSFHLSNAFNELQASARLLPEDDPRRASIVSLAGGVSAVKEVA